jgi:branched-chain amino acid transport system ATP-binding protein
MDLLEISSVDVFYGNIQVLWGIDLRIEDGGFVALIGSNGAGKTTLLKSIMGLVPIASGEIRFFGKGTSKIQSYQRARKGISLVPEGRGLFPEMTVMEHLELAAYTSRSFKIKDKNLSWVFELFPVLEERKSQVGGTLSGGEQQMLAVGRALMMNPKLLMLDEPSLGLAPKVVSQLFSTVTEVNRRGVTTLLVEQNVSYALTHASRGYIIENGRVVLKGEARNLRENEQIKVAYLGI